MILAEKLWKDGPLFSQAWNFGPLNYEEKPVSQLISKFTNEFKELRINYDKNDNHESENLSLDSNKAKKKLDWKNKFDLEKTISWTIDWYKKFLNDENMKEYSEQQIENFTSL